MRFQFMRWKKDALGAKIPTTKSDQAGKLSYLKLLFASPEDPETCVILSLALDVCSKSRFDNLNSFQTVFSSTFRNSVYTNLRAFIDNLADEDKAAMQVGIRPDADKAGFLDMRMRIADFTNKLA